MTDGNTDKKKPSLDEVRSLHGGYWRNDHIDFHYLFNHHFPTPEMYAEMAEALPTIGNYYPSSQRTLAQLLSRWKDAPHFNADNLIVGNGSSELIKLFLDHVATRVTVPLPTFNEFVRGPPEKVHTYWTQEADRFVIDSDKLIDEVRRSGSKFAVIINPGNPVGNLTPLSDIERVLDSGVTVVTDEAFMAFAGPEFSAEQLIPEYENLAVITSCTKSIGIAGLRLGYLLSRNEHLKSKIRDHIPIWNINSLTEHVVELLPRYREEHQASLRRSVEDTRWFFDELREVDYLEPFPTHANAVFCKVDGSARKLAEILYDRYNLMVKEGLNQKGLETDSYIRLGVRNREDNQRLLDALHEVSGDNLRYQA